LRTSGIEQIEAGFNTGLEELDSLESIFYFWKWLELVLKNRMTRIQK